MNREAPMTYNSTRALELLRTGSGQPTATFHPGQEEAIRELLIGNPRQLVIQRTGWGKSFVYFIAARLIREAGMGPTIIISPLLALMRNQIAAAERMGLRAITINSSNVEEWQSAEQAVRAGQADVLLISPERLANQRFRQEVLAPISSRIGMLVIDEAHCISDWGHDFRPHYRLIQRVIANLPPNVRVLATTATANNRVLEDVRDILGKQVSVLRGPLHRASLTLQSISLGSTAERMAWLVSTLRKLNGSGIVYTLTKRDASQVAAWLRANGLTAEAYTGSTGESRPALEKALLNNELKALVATSALGMGFDKPDLGFVIHYQTPGSVIACYQQVGRAGRGIKAAYGVLLTASDDSDINNWFIDSAFPTHDEVRSVMRLLADRPSGASTAELQVALNIRRARLLKTVELLSLESPAPVVKDGTVWRRTAAPVPASFWERVDRLTALRREELEQMKEYAALPFGDHMPFLLRALDAVDGEIPPPSLPPLSSEVNHDLVIAASAFLRRTEIVVKPRLQWPGGGLPQARVSGKIRPEHRVQEGRALCFWGDAGWGGEVRDAKYKEAHFGDKLVVALAEVARNWNPAPRPTWVTCVPSHRNPKLVPDAAARIAKQLGLPFHPVIAIGEPRPEQKTMANAVQQALNVDGAFRISGKVPAGPVLLIDDVIDSRWTTTMCGWLLRKAGSGEVFPLAFATASGDDAGHDEDA